MRKLVCLAAICVLMLGIGHGCGGGDSKDNDEQTIVAEETSEAEDEETPENEETPVATEAPSEFTYDEVISTSILDLEEYWTTMMPELYGFEYDPLAGIGPYFVSVGDVPECGEPVTDPEVFSGNAFYCPIGDFIAWDEEELFPQLYNDYGDFAVALVLAHEWGHAIQARTVADGPTILLELQADCFAGAWTGNIDAGLSNNIVLSPGDIDEAISGFLQFRDTPGTSAFDSDAHGSAFDRVNAFAEGYSQGAERCAEYEDVAPTIVPLEFTTQEEFDSGGDLPYEDIAPLMTADLDAYWTEVFPQLFDFEWTPLAAFGPYYVSEPETLPDCGSNPADPETYAGNAFYCAADDYIAWDDEGLMPDLYDYFGDFAVALVIGHEWSHAVQERAGFTGPTTLDIELQADCFAGAWVAWIILEQSPNLTLSPGDLDEAIAGFVVAGDAQDDTDESTAVRGTVFQRVSAFQDGVINGAEACVPYAE